MSIQSVLTFRFQEEPLAVLRHLLNGEWEILNATEGGLWLPVGAVDVGDWEVIPPESQLWEALREKSRREEELGVTIGWRGSPHGAALRLGTEEGNLSVSINRRITKEGVTDVSWYLGRILPFLTVSEWSWEELR